MVRPTGITVLAILALVFGALWVIGGAVVAFAGGISAIFLPPIGAIGIVGGILMLILGGLYLLGGWGLWTLQYWAWVLTAVLIAINVLQAAMQLFVEPITGLFWFAVNGLILWYLFQPRVRGAFERRVPPASRVA